MHTSTDLWPYRMIHPESCKANQTIYASQNIQKTCGNINKNDRLNEEKGNNDTKESYTNRS